MWPIGSDSNLKETIMIRIHDAGMNAQGLQLFAIEVVKKARKVQKRAKKVDRSEQSKKMKKYWAKRRAEKAAQATAPKVEIVPASQS